MFLKYDNKFNGKWTLQVFANQDDDRPAIAFQKGPKSSGLAEFVDDLVEFAETGEPTDGACEVNGEEAGEKKVS
jgi:hypothetical protein